LYLSLPHPFHFLHVKDVLTAESLREIKAISGGELSPPSFLEKKKE
jgi:hypothetical protein